MILENYNSKGFGQNRKRFLSGDFTDIENALYTWFVKARSENIPISSPILALKAEVLAKKLNYENFKASNGFIERFKQCQNIVYKTSSGESLSVELDCVQKWKEKLPSLINGYEPRNIFNANETGLFYKLQPNKTLTFKGETCSGRINSKDRVTVRVCCNMDGIEKIKPLVLGKFNNLRCFKGIKTLPVEYGANSKAWMTSEFFERWVQKIDKKMRLENREILLFIDNCPANPAVKNLKNTKLIFLPPNSTSFLQPCDQGIIQSLKVNYRKCLLIVENVLDDFEKKQETTITLLNAVNWLLKAWHQVTPKCIQDCFRKAGFFIPMITTSDEIVDHSEHDFDDDLSLAKLADLLRKTCDSRNSVTDIELSDYVGVDSQVISTETLTDDDIVNKIRGEIEDDETETNKGGDDSGASVETPETPEISANDALNTITILQTFFVQKTDTADSTFSMLQTLIDNIETYQRIIKKQLLFTQSLSLAK